MPISMRIFKISMCPRHARKSPESVDIKNVKIGSAVWEILHFGHPDTQTDKVLFYIYRFNNILKFMLFRKANCTPDFEYEEI